MKSIKLSFLCAAALFCAAAPRAEVTTYVAVPRGSMLKIDGDSNIHKWTVESQLIGGILELESNFPLDPSKEAPKDLTLKPTVKVRIPVRQIMSGKSTMDNVMHGAMKADEHPTIIYTLLEMTFKGKSDAGLTFATKGTITCAGVTTTNAFDVVMSKVDDKKLKVTGATNLKMSDFKIDPPSPKIALGAIKTYDDIKLTFEWLTAKRAEKSE